ncbi:MAG: hypothetical protein JRJ51_10470 [Deltaproteobacteria bacterium]|nr:hypothetical protein [Deltaproteobacteria bacterium]
MTEKVQIQDLPVTDQFLRQKRLIQERGELALIEDGMGFRHLGYTEHFYVITGKLRVQLVDLDTQEKKSVLLHPGQRAVIGPRCAHRFTAEEDAQVIEYYDSEYDPDDDMPYRDF